MQIARNMRTVKSNYIIIITSACCLYVDGLEFLAPWHSLHSRITVFRILDCSILEPLHSRITDSRLQHPGTVLRPADSGIADCNIDLIDIPQFLSDFKSGIDLCNRYVRVATFSGAHATYTWHAQRSQCDYYSSIFLIKFNKF